jgi:4-hydroxy-tetrahydrodipicolinate reductase
VKIALVGYGRMGRAVEEAAIERGHKIVARIDAAESPPGAGLPTEGLNGAEVAIEFSVPDAAADNIAALASAGVDVACGTTGWYDQLDEARRAAQAAGTGLIYAPNFSLVYAPNFSLGMQAFFRLAQAAAQLAERLTDWDVHLLEAHHRHKVDHPSGTARQLAELLLGELSRKERWELGTESGAVDPEALQVTAVRAGEIVGMHSIGLEGPGDRIELRHEARNRGGFARGAVAAAEWIQGRKGVYTLDDMLKELWS